MTKTAFVNLAAALAALVVLGAPAVALGGLLVPTAAAPAPDPAPGAMDQAGRGMWFDVARALHDDPDQAARTLARVVEAGFSDTPYVAGPGAQYSYTWLIGDIDGNKAADFAFDTHCVDVDGCGESVNPLRVECTRPHTLAALSGVDADVLWKLELSPAGVPYVECTVDTVIDTVPRAGTGLNDILVYRWKATGIDPTLLTIEHTYWLIDAATGQPRWEYKGTGSLVGSCCGLAAAITATDLFLIPVLQTPGPGTAVGPTTTPSLHLRGWGFAMERALVSHRDLGGNVVYVYDYKPSETLAHVDLTDGSEEWKVTSFQAQEDRSVVPESYHAREWRFLPIHRSGPQTSQNPFELQSSHYVGKACCGDLTGDGVPEVVYTTFEWYPIIAPQLPSTPEGMGSRVLVFNGANGQRLWSLELESADPDLREVKLHNVGDADGDGAYDLATSRLYYEAIQDGVQINPEFLMEIRKGDDGTVLWDIKDVASVDLQPIGDVDGDGGSDLLTIVYSSLVAEDDGNGSASIRSEGVAAVGSIDLVARHGKSGVPLWSTTTYAGALDVILNKRAYSATGLPDFNGDGVAEVWTDQLEILDDQTVAHRISTLNGQDGRPLHQVDALGAFAIPLGLADITGDGRQDFFVIQGDILDLWMTAHNGANGTSEWSRRLLATPQASPLLALPFFRYYNADIDGANGTDVFLSFDMTSVSADARDGGTKATTNAQILALAGAEGRLFWGLPDVEEGDESLRRYLPSPATEIYVENVVESGGGLSESAASGGAGAPKMLVPAAVGAGALSLGAAFTVGLLRRRP